MKLLLAVDLQEDADLVFERARPWVERLAGTLDLVYVDRLLEFRRVVADPDLRKRLDAEVDHLRERSHAGLKALLERLPDANRGQTHVTSGDPAASVAAMSADYDLVLLGTHGRKGVSQFFLGSVASRVVRESTVPVLVLRGPG